MIQFVTELCEFVICLKHLKDLYETASMLLGFSIIFEYSYIYLGYQIWKARIWTHDDNDYHEKSHFQLV
ncbi:14724_t:CDS:2 [Funneliformis mosseae]|uniref:14724_t:CDS:1 n=1 Tax=Funneliformis mosseae TaxID=27381 RepID=A0A9N9NFQ6_FUNMO|nr:14724_t:CDS:2 [Funneliformis mosseae]